MVIQQINESSSLSATFLGEVPLEVFVGLSQLLLSCHTFAGERGDVLFSWASSHQNLACQIYLCDVMCIMGERGGHQTMHILLIDRPCEISWSKTKFFHIGISSLLMICFSKKISYKRPCNCACY